MRIRVSENETLVREVMEEGVSRVETRTRPTGRTWDIEFDETEIGGALRSAMTEFSGEVRWLIELAANKLR